MHRWTVAVALCAALVTASAPAQPQLPPRPQRAMWLWDPDPMLTGAAARETFFDFLAREQVTVVWAQIGTADRRLTFEPEWRALLGEATRRHVRIEALDGAPEYAIDEAVPKRIVEAVLAFNRAAAPEERFGGVHLDIEPYLLWSWRSPQGRLDVLGRYLNLLQWCKTRISSDFPAMKVGVDIPFWWQAIDDRTGRAIGDVVFNGERKTASYHVIDMLDNVGIMNYRNHAAGPNGMVSLGEDLLVYADRARKATLWMGVETSRESPAPVWFAVGLPSQAARPLLDQARAIGQRRQFKGYTLTVFDDGTCTHVGLRARGVDLARPPQALTAALAELARTFGALSQPGPDTRGEFARNRLLRSLDHDPEWQAPEARVIVDPESGREYPGVVATSIMLPALTFEGHPPEEFRREVAAAEKAFSTHASFAGMAIHHFESYRRLLGGSPGAESDARLNLPGRLVY